MKNAEDAEILGATATYQGTWVQVLETLGGLTRVRWLEPSSEMHFGVPVFQRGDVAEVRTGELKLSKEEQLMQEANEAVRQELIDFIETLRPDILPELFRIVKIESDRLKGLERGVPE